MFQAEIMMRKPLPSTPDLLRPLLIALLLTVAGAGQAEERWRTLDKAVDTS